MTPLNEDDISIEIHDVLEVEKAKWVPLSELTSNDPEKTNYYMYPNAFRFMECINYWIKNGSKYEINEHLAGFENS